MTMARKPPTRIAGKTFRTDTGGTVKMAKATTPLMPPKRSAPTNRKGRKG
jgi:hypothetical protein